MQCHATTATRHRSRYAKCIEVSKRIRWDIDRDVIRGREFDLARQVPARRPVARRASSTSSSADERRFLSQVQGRTYANMFGLVERFIGAKMLEVSRDHWLGDQTALEALVRFTDEELKHQELFRRIELLVGRRHAAGLPLRCRSPTTSRAFVLGKSHLGGARADLPHRAVHAGALPRRASPPTRRPLGAVQGRVPVPLEGGVAARDPRRARMAARGREARRRRERDARGRRPDRAGRRRRRHPAGAGAGRLRVLPGQQPQAGVLDAGEAEAAAAMLRPTAGSTSSRAPASRARRTADG